MVRTTASALNEITSPISAKMIVFLAREIFSGSPLLFTKSIAATIMTTTATAANVPKITASPLLIWPSLAVTPGRFTAQSAALQLSGRGLAAWANRVVSVII